jgi:hypothetical protein
MRWVLPGQLDAAVTGWFGASPVKLDMSHSQSYADWLSRHRVTAFHRQEGEESPARRRQDQTRHLISGGPGPEAALTAQVSHEEGS